MAKEINHVNVLSVISFRGSAVIVPGLLAGIAIWAAISGGSAWLTATGHEGGRATLFMATMLTAVPVLMFAAGGAAAAMHRRDRPGAGNLRVPYLAGFFAGLCAGFLMAVESGLKQYVPHMLPGLLPRLAFTAGRVIIYMPFVAILSIFYALCALAGGWCIYLMQETKLPDIGPNDS